MVNFFARFSSRLTLAATSHRLMMLLLLASTLAPALLLSGCRSGSTSGPFPIWAYSDDGDYLPKPSGGGLVVDPDSPIPDVPKPIGFVGVPSKSSSSTDGLTRRVQHVYQGRANPLDAAKFYRRNLDDYNWQLEDFDSGDPNATVQSYVKGPEQLRLGITGSGGITTISLTLSPRTPGNAPGSGSPGN